jgi:OTU-like cysteine protease/UBA/TS-N domain
LGAGACRTRAGTSRSHRARSPPSDLDEPYNSEDEHGHGHAREATAPLTERGFAAVLAKRGLRIVPVRADGNCLFRALAVHVYGEEDAHGIVRAGVMDFLATHRAWFSMFVAEDFARYVRRKRRSGCHGNHLELQAAAELYSRPIHVFSYSSEPVNVIECGVASAEGPGDEMAPIAPVAAAAAAAIRLLPHAPLRLTFHRGSHYNCLLTVDPALLAASQREHYHQQHRQHFRETHPVPPPEQKPHTSMSPALTPSCAAEARRVPPCQSHASHAIGGASNAASSSSSGSPSSSPAAGHSDALPGDLSLSPRVPEDDDGVAMAELADALATEDEMEQAAIALSLAEARGASVVTGASSSAAAIRPPAVQTLVELGFDEDMVLQAYHATGRGRVAEILAHISPELSGGKPAFSPSRHLPPPCGAAQSQQQRPCSRHGKQASPHQQCQHSGHCRHHRHDCRLCCRKQTSSASASCLRRVSSSSSSSSSASSSS